MGIKRRDFIKMWGAAPILLLPGLASAQKLVNVDNAPAKAALDPRIKKSIKANFGSGFELRNHKRSAGLTYADIEHNGNLYQVASADALDWEIVSSEASL